MPDPILILRIPAPLKARIEKAARANDRSVSAEARRTLKRAYSVPMQDECQYDAVSASAQPSAPEAAR
jgi:hypothetical protein